MHLIFVVVEIIIKSDRHSLFHYERRAGVLCRPREAGDFKLEATDEESVKDFKQKGESSHEYFSFERKPTPEGKY